MFGSIRNRINGKLRRIRLQYASFTELNALSKPIFDPDMAVQFSKTGYCFIHIPKNGGTTIESLLYQSRLGHHPWYKIYYLSPVAYERWIKFCVIRDPIDRFLSSYDYLKLGGRNEIDSEIGRRFFKNKDINDFIRKLQEPKFRAQIMRYFHFQPQANFVMSCDRICMIDKIVPFEELNKKIASMLNIDENSIGHKNKTQGARTSPEELDKKSRKIVEYFYNNDFILYELSHTVQDDLYMKRLY